MILFVFQVGNGLYLYPFLILIYSLANIEINELQGRRGEIDIGNPKQL